MKIIAMAALLAGLTVGGVSGTASAQAGAPLPEGMRVYNGMDFRGDQGTLTWSDSNLANNTFDNGVPMNDKISSILNRSRWAIHAYSDAGYVGSLMWVDPYVEYPRLYNSDNEISSVKFICCPTS